MAELFAELPTVVSLADQIECVEREIRMRRRVYPRRVAESRMSADAARRETATMEAVLETLRQAASPGRPR